MYQSRIAQLFARYYEKTATSEERAELMQMLSDADPAVVEGLVRAQGEQLAEIEDVIENDRASAMLARILRGEEKEKRGSVIRMKFVRYAAAAVLLLAVAGTWFFVNKGSKENAPIAKKENKVIRDAKPGKTGAVLVLADGSEVSLDDMQNGEVRKGIVKKDSSIVYGSAETVAMNTLRTTRGRSFSATLADGTKVWLNAGSSIEYPTAFKGTNREVKITGEVYFEVAKNAKQPFIVQTPSDRIEVLGTHFNVNAYEDEGVVRTTLLEGSVQMNKVMILKPGEQYANGKIKTVNTGAVVSWVYGSFSFEGADIQTVMRQLSRWYDVEVRYEGKPTTELFGGEILRSLNLSQVLKAMEFTGIHYTLDGKTLVITN